MFVFTASVSTIRVPARPHPPKSNVYIPPVDEVALYEARAPSPLALQRYPTSAYNAQAGPLTSIYGAQGGPSSRPPSSVTLVYNSQARSSSSMYNTQAAHGPGPSNNPFAPYAQSDSRNDLYYTYWWSVFGFFNICQCRGGAKWVFGSQVHQSDQCTCMSDSFTSLVLFIVDHEFSD